MQVSLVPGQYTRINTDRQKYILQNLSNYDIYIKIADTVPASDEEYDFVIGPKCGFTSSHAIETVWGMPSGNTASNVGIVEG